MLTIGFLPANQEPTYMSSLTPEQQTELEAAAFRRLVEHLDSRKDAQNICLLYTSDAADD